jgi:hypothetical protein
MNSWRQVPRGIERRDHQHNDTVVLAVQSRSRPSRRGRSFSPRSRKVRSLSGRPSASRVRSSPSLHQSGGTSPASPAGRRARPAPRGWHLATEHRTLGRVRDEELGADGYQLPRLVRGSEGQAPVTPHARLGLRGRPAQASANRVALLRQSFRKRRLIRAGPLLDSLTARLGRTHAVGSHLPGCRCVQTDASSRPHDRPSKSESDDVPADSRKPQASCFLHPFLGNRRSHGTSPSPYLAISPSTASQQNPVW